ncbi:MAG: peptide-methionine (S)-S-oxide reductase [Algibacter sp.]
MKTITKIALGGGCHWCTEAVFQSLKGVVNVEQGYVASLDDNKWFSEAVIVHFNGDAITLSLLIEIHLYTHRSTNNHSMRNKYRSAIYAFTKAQVHQSKKVLERLQDKFDEDIITQVLMFSEFEASREAIQNYYQKNPDKPFCKQFIDPKLKLLLNKFGAYVKPV